jgi:hypothetical protein
MCSNKNGKTRKARLVSVNSLYNTSANTNICLHVLENNRSAGGFLNLGVYNTQYRIYDASTTTLQGINFPDQGCVELQPGELAIWYRESATTATTGISFTFALYYT